MLLRARTLAALAALLLLAAAPTAARAQNADPAPGTAPAITPQSSAGYQPETPPNRQLSQDGPGGRYLLDGKWLFRRDPFGQGLSHKYFRETGLANWSTVDVPNAWNAGDDSPESMTGGVVWYRKDFKVPGKSAQWIVRFESVNYRAKVWLNGRFLGEHAGAYLPWELVLSNLRKGTNRLVLQVDNRRLPTDFPPSGFTTTGEPVGGWWNYGGITREVYLRKVNQVALSAVQVVPLLPNPAGAAQMRYTAYATNYGGQTRAVQAVGHFGGQSLNLGTARIAAGGTHIFRRSLTVARPHLWSPADPFLYPASVEVRLGGHAAGTWALHSGIRSISLGPDGHLMLNGQLMNVRGVGLHEDDLRMGSAIDNTKRDQYIAWVKELGATVIRAHYPLHPYLLEQADRQGILIWSEIPVYSLKTQYFSDPGVLKAAHDQLAENILVNGSHPSVFVWSVANELASKPTPRLAAYYSSQARLAKSLDPSRPVGVATVGYPDAGCQDAYRPFDVIGINEYFGWYPGPGGQVADRDNLSEYLDTAHGCYPGKAIVISEFGAEANRDGPVEERGTYQFQQEFVRYHLDLFATKPWLSGAIYWTLQEFRVRPAWDGGNPRPQAPYHQKGLITMTGDHKPAFADVQSLYRGTPQFNPPG